MEWSVRWKKKIFIYIKIFKKKKKMPKDARGKNRKFGQHKDR